VLKGGTGVDLLEGGTGLDAVDYQDQTSGIELGGVDGLGDDPRAAFSDRSVGDS